ncbi:MAG: TAXI family TRAP transporter solute-binding subunit [Bacteroidetes bacterium]|nr:TAXI family TRAP transporter solute-binding subunit [Bacteroidota bacterium]
MKQFLVILVMVFMMVLPVFGAGEAESGSDVEEGISKTVKIPSDYISIGGNQIGQTTYTWSAAITALITSELDVPSAAEETRGVGDNITRLIAGDIEFGFMTNTNVLDANKAQGNYEGVEIGKIVSVIGLAPCETHIIVPADSDIQTVHDFAGKRVGIGQPGGNVYFLVGDVLRSLGYEESDYKAFAVSLSEQARMIRDRQLDVLIWNGTASLPAITELAVSKDIRFISMSKEDIAALSEIYPFSAATIPANTYQGQTVDVSTFQTRNTMATSIDVPEETVYQVTKLIFENLDKLAKVHAAFSKVDIDTVLLGQPVGRIHPGALRYYKEIGVPGVEEFF